MTRTPSDPASATAATSSSSPPKPPRILLPRSPSAPIHLASQTAPDLEAEGHSSPIPPQQIYVLSADGSRLFLLDPSKPGNEEPPPYAPFQPSPTGTGHSTSRSLSSTSLNQHRGAGNTGLHSPQGRLPALISPQRHGHLLPPTTGSGEDTHTRHRSRTLSALNQASQSEARPRYRTFASHSYSPPSPYPHSSSHPQAGSATSSPTVTHRVRLADETTPLLSREDNESLSAPQRGLWRSIFCGDVDVDEDTNKWARGWKRYWRPWQRKEYWRATLHLTLLNFPFALLVWPWLVIGTLVGTALLITLPIGAAIWWITLFLSRSSARLETIMQLRYHSPLNPLVSEPTYHPIFYRIKEGSGLTPPLSPISEFPPEVQWETRFVKCSYAMFADHYSYSALSYFLLIKPLITLFSTILIVALFPVCLVLVFPMPIYLRAIRRWGKWQAGIAMGNL